MKVTNKMPVVPENEMERLMSLVELDVDYSDHQHSFKDLAKLAAKVTGTKISLVNLIDSLTQWTISNYGMDVEQMLREDSVCQYTIMEKDHFEVDDLLQDERFKDKFYVNGAPNLRYYYGVPLKTGNGHQIGALCVLDYEQKTLDPEKIELMKIIADEVVTRLHTLKVMDNLKSKLLEAKQMQKKVAHDIRGPLGGIVGLAQIIRDQGYNNQMDEVLEFISLIHKSGNSILDLAGEILETSKDKTSPDRSKAIDSSVFNLIVFKDKLIKLYSPQAKHKHIHFSVITTPLTESIALPKNKLLQIAGNLISNSMKFTPEGGNVTVDLQLTTSTEQVVLYITVFDNGIGMTEESIQAIMSENAVSTEGTSGEKGYGFGLSLVKHLVSNLNGTMQITSKVGEGTTFNIRLPQNF